MRKADSSHDVLDNNEYLPIAFFELFTRQLNLSFFIVGNTTHYNRRPNAV